MGWFVNLTSPQPPSKGEMGWSAGWEEVTVSRAGDVTVSRMGRGDGQQNGEMGWSVGWGKCDG